MVLGLAVWWRLTAAVAVLYWPWGAAICPCLSWFKTALISGFSFKTRFSSSGFDLYFLKAVNVLWTNSGSFFAILPPLGAATCWNPGEPLPPLPMGLKLLKT